MSHSSTRSSLTTCTSLATPRRKFGRKVLTLAALALTSLAASAAWMGGVQDEGPFKDAMDPFTKMGHPRVIEGLDQGSRQELSVALRRKPLSGMVSEAYQASEMPALDARAQAPMSSLFGPNDLGAEEHAFCQGQIPRVGVHSYRVGPQERFFLRSSFGRFLVRVSKDVGDAASEASAQPHAATRCRIVEGEVRVALDESMTGGIVGSLIDRDQPYTFGEWSTTDKDGQWTMVKGYGAQTSWGGIELENRFSAGHRALEEAVICLRDVDLSSELTRIGIRREILDASTNEVVGYALMVFDFDCM